MFSWITAIVIFFVYIAIDICYAYYTITVIERKPMQAAFISAIIVVLAAFSIIKYVQTPWYIIPAVLGSWIGTYAVVKYIPSKDK